MRAEQKLAIYLNVKSSRVPLVREAVEIINALKTHEEQVFEDNTSDIVGESELAIRRAFVTERASTKQMAHLVMEALGDYPTTYWCSVGLNENSDRNQDDTEIEIISDFDPDSIWSRLIERIHGLKWTTGPSSLLHAAIDCTPRWHATIISDAGAVLMDSETLVDRCLSIMDNDDPKARETDIMMKISRHLEALPAEEREQYLLASLAATTFVLGDTESSAILRAAGLEGIQENSFGRDESDADDTQAPSCGHAVSP